MQSIRVNTIKVSAAELQEMLARRYSVEQVPWYDNALLVDGKELAHTIEYQTGLFYIQGLSSMLPVIAMQPKEGECILDLAAAPGSKATQIAAAMNNHGILFANDNSFMRLKALGSHIDRLGIINCAITNYDGIRFPSFRNFDRVLLDAPCSGLGSTHAHADFSANRLTQMSRLQKKLLVHAFDLLKPGGMLVYSTCTTRKEENEEVISHLLEKRDAATACKPELPVKFDYELGARISIDEAFFVASITKAIADETASIASESVNGDGADV